MNEILLVVIVYIFGGFVLWKTWPAVKELPGFIGEFLAGWAHRVELEQEQRKFLKAYAKAGEGERKRLVIQELRRHMSALGMDVSDLTDEEIEEGTARFGKAIAESGVTVEEAGRSISAALAGLGHE